MVHEPVPREPVLCEPVLCEQSAVRMRDMLARGEVSAVELVTAHLARIAERNPALNAIVTLVPERALAEAAAADAMAARARRAADPLPALHGLPVVIKDTHLTAGIRTTSGSRVYAGRVPDFDELIVARIRAAGGIVVGKTNVPEFGAGSHTFNEVFGTTVNPHDLSRSAGGSSGGSAAAVAAGLAPLADGSDMGGSLRNPASFCGVVGMRPTPGRVPSVPAALPFSTLSTQGPIARDVADVALLLSVIAGPDERSPISLTDPGASFADPPPARSPRVAVAPDLGGAIPVDDDVIAGLRPAIDAASRLGWRVEEACPDLSGAEEAFRTLRALQFAATMGGDYDKQPGLFKATLAANIEQGRALTPAAIGRAEQLRGEVYLRAVEFFARYDVLICPAAQVIPFDARLEYPRAVAGQPMGEDYLGWMRAAYWITMTGCPALSLPAGYTASGLPVGAQLVARPRADAALLGVAAALEATLPARRWPRWPPR